MAIRRLLELAHKAAESDTAFGASAKNDKEIALATRSTLDILGEASAGVAVPDSGVSEGRVIPFTKATES
jgi:hypothetical protein